jgi:hypothetical protein
MKGQTALEYLITYGWAILVILVVLAVLWYYGVFNPAKWSGESVSEGSAFKVVDKQLSSAGTFRLVLGDKTGTSTSISNVNVSGDVNGQIDLSAAPVVIPAGGQMSGNAAVAGGVITVTGITPTPSAGSFYKFTVTTTYQATGGLAGQKDVASYNIKAV